MRITDHDPRRRPAPTTELGLDIVSKIGIPMILGSVCIGFIVMLVQSVEGEKEASAAKQAKLALDIANKTLPLFRQVNSESLRRVRNYSPRYPR